MFGGNNPCSMIPYISYCLWAHTVLISYRDTLPSYFRLIGQVGDDNRLLLVYVHCLLGRENNSDPLRSNSAAVSCIVLCLVRIDLAESKSRNRISSNQIKNNKRAMNKRAERNC